MNPLTFFLLAAISLLILILFVQRRRIDELINQTPETDPPLTGRAEAIEAAASAAPLGMVIVDETGSPIFENVVSRAYGTTGDEALISLRLRNLLAETKDGAAPLERDVRLHGPRPRLIRLHAVPLVDDGLRLGTVAFIDDVTIQSQVDSMRSDFIANASHELKTPLGAMRLLAEALVATSNSDVADDLARKIEAEAVRINRLIDDILDLAILESAPLESEQVDVCDVVDAAMIQTHTFSEAVGIPVRPDCESIAVHGDRRRLVSAVANLVENALAYTAVKGIEHPEPIEVRVQREGRIAVIEVEDHGIGIPVRHQERIFERFYRVDRGRSRTSGGTGLGLAIVRHVVENHGGAISVRSVPGEGSTFRVELPVVED